MGKFIEMSVVRLLLSDTFHVHTIVLNEYWHHVLSCQFDTEPQLGQEQAYVVSGFLRTNKKIFQQQFCFMSLLQVTTYIPFLFLHVSFPHSCPFYRYILDLFLQMPPKHQCRDHDMGFLIKQSPQVLWNKTCVTFLRDKDLSSKPWSYLKPTVIMKIIFSFRRSGWNTVTDKLINEHTLSHMEQTWDTEWSFQQLPPWGWEWASCSPADPMALWGGQEHGSHLLEPLA